MPRFPALITDIPAEDARFDEHLPDQARARSRRYWTPVAVATIAAARLRERGAQTIFDVGCGPGKFCLVAGGLHPELRFHGVDQRADLVDVATEIGRRLGVTNARFTAGDATRMPWSGYDGFYFFNPFAENVFEDSEHYDETVELSETKFATDVLRVEQLLGQARLGTVVVTYHGLGGPIPSSYDLVADDPAGSDRVRTWVRTRATNELWSWMEVDDGLHRATRADIDRILQPWAAGNDVAAHLDRRG